MGITMELAALDEATLDTLDDDTTDEQVASLMFTEAERTYSAGRIWHVIHYLLTGEVGANRSPASFLLAGGQEIGPDAEYGRVRVFTCKECAAIAKALITEQEFVKRLAEWPMPDEVGYGDKVKAAPDQTDYIEIYTVLVDFIKQTVSADQGILIGLI